MINAQKKTVTGLPAQLWQSLTWDRGKELSDYARFTIESGVKVFFADPNSPWQRGTTVIPTVFCGNTSQKTPVYLVEVLKRSKQ
jgi:hypothetical protein